MLENKKSKSGPAEPGEKTHTQQHPLPPAREDTVDSCFNLRLKPKLKPDPLTVWLVDVAMCGAGAHGGVGRGLWISESVSSGLPCS